MMINIQSTLIHIKSYVYLKNMFIHQESIIFSSSLKSVTLYYIIINKFILGYNPRKGFSPFFLSRDFIIFVVVVAVVEKLQKIYFVSRNIIRNKYLTKNIYQKILFKQILYKKCF